MRKGIEGLAMLVQGSPGWRPSFRRYTLSRWKALCRFVDDGRIELEQSSRARDQAYRARS
jgi:hypothetical protein